MSDSSINTLKEEIRQWAIELGFQDIGFSTLDLSEADQHLQNWLDAGFHGDMDYMAKHGSKRTHPNELEPHTTSVISVRMDYWQDDNPQNILASSGKAYIARYAQGRDYHKLMRKRLATLAAKIEENAGGQHRAFVDSAPVMERALAEQAGLGWIGKNTMLINSQAGSWFFLGEIYTSLPLAEPLPETTEEHCGSCTRCLDICPTNAFNKAWQLDARKCISYLTIELSGSIPIELRPLIGNRVFGCDDCIIVCPWNKFAQTTQEQDFKTRPQLDDKTLLELFNWNEEEYLRNTEGSALRRIGYQRWLRNLAVGLGNAKQSTTICKALENKKPDADKMALEHIEWALQQHNTTAQKKQRNL